MTPVWGVWLGDVFYFSTGPRSRKARNLSINPHCVVSPELADNAIILEGIAKRVTNTALLRQVADAYSAKYQWPIEPTREGVRDQNGNEGPVFAVRPRVVFAWDEFPQDATRWIFNTPGKHESVLTFFALVFALSIPFWMWSTIAPIQLLPRLPISAIGALTPTLAVVILIYKDARLSSVLRLLQRSFDFKRIKNKIWLLIAVLINPVIAVLSYGIMRVMGVSLPNPAPLILAIFPMFAFFFMGALAEEIGWSGYATEPLQRHWGTISAGVLLGSVWAVWHFIPLMQAHRSAEWIAWWSLGTISLRTIMVWLYIHSGRSVFVASVFHAMINLCWQLFPINGSFYDPRVFGLIAVCFAIAVLTAERLLMKSKMQMA
jgi:membrane protease YdiL (CAAX protease family)